MKQKLKRSTWNGRNDTHGRKIPSLFIQGRLKELLVLNKTKKDIPKLKGNESVAPIITDWNNLERVTKLLVNKNARP